MGGKKDKKAAAVRAADSVDSLCQGWASRHQATGRLPIGLSACQVEVKLLMVDVYGAGREPWSTTEKLEFCSSPPWFSVRKA